ncbi:MAG: SDR family oxidoreductase [Acidobacteria bacterium]|nr:SDR family oxidoreductase [Acidobacteriota bacterium]
MPRRASLRPSSTLIAGCGYVGTALARLLAADGHKVYGLRRSRDVDVPGVETVRADLGDLASLRGLAPGIQAVVYAASGGERSEEAYRRAYVEGPRNLLRALEEGGQRVERFVFVSSTGVYAQDDGEWVDERSVTEPGGFSGRLLLEGEAVVREGPFPATVLRLAGIYGPGRTRMIEQVRRGEARCTAEPSYTNRIHRDDCARALQHILSLEAPDDPYLGVDDDPADRSAVLRWLAVRLGRPMPEVEDSASSGVGGTNQRAGGRNKRCSNARLVGSGFRLRYPSFRDGYAAMLAADDAE